MAEVVTFTRVYPFADGLAHEATPQRVSTVIASMNEHRDSTVPFKVRLRYDDGSVVTVKPKGTRRG